MTSLHWPQAIRNVNYLSLPLQTTRMHRWGTSDAQNINEHSTRLDTSSDIYVHIIQSLVWSRIFCIALVWSRYGHEIYSHCIKSFINIYRFIYYINSTWPRNPSFRFVIALIYECISAIDASRLSCSIRPWWPRMPIIAYIAISPQLLESSANITMTLIRIW